jgi:hypothetical protein
MAEFGRRNPGQRGGKGEVPHLNRRGSSRWERTAVLQVWGNISDVKVFSLDLNDKVSQIRASVAEPRPSRTLINS